MEPSAFRHFRAIPRDIPVCSRKEWVWTDPPKEPVPRFAVLPVPSKLRRFPSVTPSVSRDILAGDTQVLPLICRAHRYLPAYPSRHESNRPACAEDAAMFAAKSICKQSRYWRIQPRWGYRSALAKVRMCSGPKPQQPPTACTPSATQVTATLA